MISSELIDKVLAQASAAASHSWEYGTVFEALLEYHNPEHSIFNSPFLRHEIPSPNIQDLLALQYVKPYIRTDSTTLCEGNGMRTSLLYFCEKDPNHKAQAHQQTQRPSAYPHYYSAKATLHTLTQPLAS